jgi:DNA polymerase-3 subunit alpha
MEAQKERLMQGFMEYGKLEKGKAEAIWKLIEPFAAYGFNKAHAASYGKVAYQTAYMKANYPVEYMAALLTGDSGDVEKIAILVAECERMKIPVLPPDVNESGATFTIVGEEKNAIRFGLSSIKNFGEGISEAIIAERAKGPFASLSDFLARVGDKSLNRKSLESLIKCGALDSLAGDYGGRGTLLAHIETLLSFHREAAAPASQDTLFAAAAPVLSLPQTTGEASLSDMLSWERELLGIYVSGHPLDAHAEKTKKATVTIGSILAEPSSGLPVILPALVSEVRTILTKKGEKMAFVKLEDKSGSIESVIFPKLYKEFAPYVVAGQCLLVKATVSQRNGELSLAFDNLKPL